MNWVLLAALPPLLWALSNVVDQFLVRDHFSGSPAGFIALSGLATVPVLLGMVFFAPAVWAVPFMMKGGLMLMGMLVMLSVWPYMTALQEDDVSVVIPLYQMVPLFTFLLGWIILHEIPTLRQCFGALVIVLAAAFVAWDFNSGTLRRRTLILMAASSLIYAALTVLLRFLTNRLAVTDIFFWEGVGWLSLVPVLLLHPATRKHIIHSFAVSRGRIYLWGCLQNGADVTAHIALIAALAAGPSAGMVMVMSGLQPFYIIVLGGLCAVLRPDLYTKTRLDRHLLQKIFCAAMLFSGLYVVLGL